MPVSPEHVVAALRQLGGERHVGEITALVEQIAPRPHPKSVRASVRRILQEHCRASGHYREPELFINVYGLSASQGVWKLIEPERNASDDPPNSLIVATHGSDWTRSEVEICVKAYFEMLKLEIEGKPFRKVEFNQSVQAATGRNKGSVEFKFQNISAVLDQLGLRWIQGYRPAKKAQTNAITDAIERLLGADLVLAGLLEMPLPTEVEPASSPVPSSVFVEPPPQSVAPSDHPILLPGSRVRKFDRVLTDARKRELGRAGEQFVLDIERKRLKAEGRSDLADKVSWVAEIQGDGAGYDIASFDKDGSPRLIEVKTTNGDAMTSFLVTTNEVEVSRANPDTFWLYRVYDFAKQPRIYCMKGPLDDGWTLEPALFKARR